MNTEAIFTAIVLFIMAICVVSVAVRYLVFYHSEHFQCPHCRRRFKPKVSKMIFSINAVEGKIIRCPYCGCKEYMEPKKDKKT